MHDHPRDPAADGPGADPGPHGTGSWQRFRCPCGRHVSAPPDSVAVRDGRCLRCRRRAAREALRQAI